MLLEPWFANPAKTLVRRPKPYLRDAGLAAFLCGVFTIEALHASPLAGKLWETLVCAEIRRSRSNRRGGWELDFRRDRRREADFLLHRAGSFQLADAKWTEHPAARDAEALRGVARELPAGAVETMSIFCRRPTPIRSATATSTPVRSTRRRPWRAGYSAGLGHAGGAAGRCPGPDGLPLSLHAVAGMRRGAPWRESA